MRTKASCEQVGRRLVREVGRGRVGRGRGSVPSTLPMFECCRAAPPAVLRPRAMQRVILLNYVPSAGLLGRVLGSSAARGAPSDYTAAFEVLPLAFRLKPVRHRRLLHWHPKDAHVRARVMASQCPPILYANARHPTNPPRNGRSLLRLRWRPRVGYALVSCRKCYSSAGIPRSGSCCSIRMARGAPREPLVPRPTAFAGDRPPRRFLHPANSQGRRLWGRCLTTSHPGPLPPPQPALDSPLNGPHPGTHPPKVRRCEHSPKQAE